MGKPIAITRLDLSATELRERAAKMHDGAVVRRLLGIASVLEGASRQAAATAAGMDRQTLCDWIHRYNENGVAGLSSRTSPGRSGGAVHSGCSILAWGTSSSNSTTSRRALGERSW